MKRPCQAGGNQKQAVGTSAKVDLRTKSSIRDEKADYMRIKDEIHQEEISILNTDVPSKIASAYVKEAL